MAVVTSVTGGTPPYSYVWLEADGTTPIPGETDDTITGLAPTNYWVRVTDSEAPFPNIYHEPFTIGQPNSIVIFSVNTLDVSCNGLNDGAISISAFGGTAPLEYSNDSASSFQGSNIFPALYAGEYNIVVQDANNCIKYWSSNPVEINEPDSLDITVDSITDVTCSYLTDGSIDVTVNGGTAPFDYAWTGPGTYTNDIEDISGLDSGNYDLMVTDYNGCSDNVGPLTVSKPSEITVSTDSIKDVKCNGDNSGAIYVSVTGGTPGYSYSWTDGVSYSASTQDIENLFAGSYSLQVTDTMSCIKNHGSLPVDQPTPISIIEENPVVNVSCNGLNDGEITVSVSGGKVPYSYAWSGPSFSDNTQDIDSLYAGFYSLIVTDANGCTQSYGPIEVTEPAVLTLVHDSTRDVTCFGLSDGAVYVTPGGGTQSYTFKWSDGAAFSASTDDITGVPAATYSVILTDANSCADTITGLLVDQPVVLSAVTDVVTHVTCYGDSTGSITVNVTGGTLPYSYSWTDGVTFSATTRDILDIPSGNYTLTVDDANGCNDVLGPVPVNEPTEITVNTDSTKDVKCNGGNTGAIYISVTNGTTGYTYSWTDGGSYSEITQDIEDLFAGSYTVEVTDGAGCKKNHGPVAVSEPPALVITQDSLSQVTCNGDGDGGIYVTVTGGTGGYTYNWTDGGGPYSTDEDIENLPPGNYSLEVTDGNGCTANLGPVSITQPPVLVATLDSVDHITCKGAMNGAIYVSVAGGTEPYGYAWTGDGSYSSILEDITALDSGAYSLVVTDANGCTDALGPVAVNEPDTIEVTVEPGSKLALDCAGDMDGSIDITISGGTPGFTVSWTGPNGFTSASADIAGLEAGDYDILVQDINGCTRSYSPLATITEPTPLVITQDSLSQVTCNGDGDGGIYVTVTGGTGGYTYNWTDGGGPYSTDEDIENLPPGNYSLEVTDGNGCTANLGPVSITQPPVLVATLDSVDHITCKGAMNGAIYVSVAGGTEPYGYAWTGDGSYSSILEDITALDSGAYSLVVTDANGCTDALGPVAVNEPDSIRVAVDGSSNLALGCYGYSDGSIDITITGGTPLFTVSWTGPNGFTSASEDISGLDAGDYDILVQDANNCTRSYSPLATITEPDSLTISLDKTDIACYNDNNGTITVSAGGGTRPYEYSRNGSNWQTDSIFTGLNPIGYTIYVRSQGSPPACMASDTISINQPELLDIYNTSVDNSNQNCYGDSNGVITILARGGTAPIRYSIDSGYNFVFNNIFSNLPAGYYQTVVTDANGCLDYGSIMEVPERTKITITTYNQTDITDCYYSPSGEIFIEASGGYTPIRYIMDGADTNITGIFNNLVVGPHTIDILDAKGCTEDTSVVINSPPPIGATSFDVVDVTTCYGDSTGSLMIHATGGTGPLEFSLEGGPFQSDSLFDQLPGGDYTITVRDSNNCEIYPSQVINSPDSIGYDSIVIDHVSCTGYMDGSITVYGNGGTAPYEYIMNPGADTNATGVFGMLSPGFYTITIGDAHNCPGYTTPGLEVVDPPLLSIDSVRYTEISCNGTDDGAIEIYSSGGVGAHQYSVNDGPPFTPGSVYTGLAPATYYVIIQDSNACTVRGDTVVMTDPPAILTGSQGSSDVSTCYGDSTGSISLSASGGTGGLEYSLDSVTWQVSGDFAGLPAGTYTPYVRDSIFCAESFAQEVIAQPEPVTASISTTTSMNGQKGSIIISGAMGGTGALTYSDSGLAGPFVTDTVFLEWPGFYDVAVMDDNGCTYEETVQVDATPPLEVNVSYTEVDCYGAGNGSITLVPVNATGDVQYSIYDGDSLQTTGTFSGLPGDEYLIFVRDDDMRIYWDTVDLNEPPPFDVTATVVPATCSQYSYDGSVMLTVGGATPGYTYLWSNDSTTEDITGLEQGTYSVIINDASLCEYRDTFEINATTTLIANAGRDTALCYQEQYILSGSGGDNYLWTPETGLSNPGIPDPVATVSDSITYVLTVTLDASPCYSKDTVTLTVHPGRDLDAGLDTTVAVGQTINLFAAGGPYSSYQWQPADALDDPNSRSPGLVVSTPATYTVIATTEFGCVEMDSMTIRIAGGLNIYTGFTPNDDGINDLWDIDFVEYYPNITVAVFDRWGRQVFYSDGYTSEKRWDGKLDGKDLPTGTYYYIINLNDGSPILKGPVTIVR